MASRKFKAAYLILLSIVFVDVFYQHNSHLKRVIASESDREEILIKDAYVKLSLRNAAANKDAAEGKFSTYDPKEDLSFEIRNIHTGPISEILEKKLYDLTTFPSGDIIRITRNTIRFNGRSEEYVGYSARMEVGQYTTAVAPKNLTIKETMDSLGSNYADVGKYSAYEVYAKLGKMSRAYKAMVIYHSSYNSAPKPELEFWDWIVGTGNALNEVRKENRPLVGSQKNEKFNREDDVTGNLRQVDPLRKSYQEKTVFDCSDDQPICCPQGSSSLAQCCWNPRYAYTNPGIAQNCSGFGLDRKVGQPPVQEQLFYKESYVDIDRSRMTKDTASCIENASYGPMELFYDHGDRDHLTGIHSYKVNMQGVCRLYSNCTTSCRVNTNDVMYYETPLFVSHFYLFHYGNEDVKEERGSGSGSDSITCKKSHGVGTMGCYIPYCGGSVNVSLPSTSSGSGSVAVTGGTLWNRGWGLGHTCKFSGLISGNPGGSGGGQCGPGTGSYCFYSSNGASCNQGTFAFPPCCCFWSPIVLDISKPWDWATNSGNGYHFTSVDDGVRFDLDGDGVKEQVAWPTATSENAWLALDRNGNGVIDSGKELFGNFTDQTGLYGEPVPIGQGNGWRALAGFDRGMNGGNDNMIIDRGDAVFANLRLWVDRNHNGISEPSELITLDSIGITKIEYNYQDTPWADEFGNSFKLKARFVWGDLFEEPYVEWFKDAWDVFPQWSL